MFSASATTQVHATKPPKMDDVMGAAVDSSIEDPQVNLLDLDMDFEFMSAERRQQLMSPLPMQSDVPCQLQCNDAQMYGGPDDGLNDLAKTQPYHASPNGQARLGRDFQSFDVAPAPRLTKAHRRRRSPYRIYNAPYRRSDYYTPDYAQHFDRDAAHPRRDHYRHRIPSPEAIKHRSEAIFVPAMADLDVREERDYDKRGTDSYRGGGNKRRRDGKLLTAVEPLPQS
jgi:hypothetical protein